MSLLGSVPAHPADDVIVQDVEAGGEDGGPDEEVDGAGPQVRLAGPEAPEADGGQRHEAEVEGVVKAPVLKSTNKLKYFPLHRRRPHSSLPSQLFAPYTVLYSSAATQ